MLLRVAEAQRDGHKEEAGQQGQGSEGGDPAVIPAG